MVQDAVVGPQRADELEADVQMLQGKLIQLEEAAEENERLKGLLDLRDKGTYPDGTDFEVADVVVKSPTRWASWIMINKGSADGVRVGLPVVGATPAAGETLAGKGLVGKVTQVTAHTAKVCSSPILGRASPPRSRDCGQRASSRVRCRAV